MKRILTLLLCCVLIVTGIPMTALAAETVETNQTEELAETEELISIEDIEKTEEVEDTEETVASEEVEDTEETVASEEVEDTEETVALEELENEEKTVVTEELDCDDYYKYDINGNLVCLNQEEYRENIASVVTMGTTTKKPTGLIWGGSDNNYNHGDIAWKTVEGAKGCYELVVEKKDSANEWQTYYSTCLLNYRAEQNGEINFPFSGEISESGEYRFKVAVRISDSKCGTYSEYSDVYTYTRPSKTLGTSDNLWWDEDYSTKARWEAVENADGYDVMLMREENGEWVEIAGSRCYSRDFLSNDFLRYINREEDVAFSVRALSNDIELRANGDYSDTSEVLKAATSVVKISEAIDAALNEIELNANYDAALNRLKEEDIEDIAIALQSNSSVQDVLKLLEDKYASNKQITVSSTTDEATEMYMDTSKISVLGAALNATEGNSEVQLSFSNPVNATDETHANAIQFSISATGVSNTQMLDVPMRITVPIPSNIKVTHAFFIEHIHQDKTREVIYPDINGDGTASFTVTSFSDFIFAEEPDLNAAPNFLLDGKKIPSKLSVKNTGKLSIVADNNPEYENRIIWSSLNSNVANAVQYVNKANGTAEIRLNKKGTTILTATDSKNSKILKRVLICVESNDFSTSPTYETIDDNEMILHAFVNEKCVYTGSPIKPEPSVYADFTKLEKGKDYTLSYKNNTKAASEYSDGKVPTIVITGKGMYSGKTELKFTIDSKPITSLPNVTKIWTLEKDNVQKLVPTVKDGKKTLKRDVDFTCVYESTSEGAYQLPGSYYICVKGIGNYTGEMAFFEVVMPKTAISISKATINAPKTASYNDGKEVTVEFDVSIGKTKLEKDVDYNVYSYLNNTQMGKATCIIEGIGKYCGSKIFYFNIKGKKLSDCVTVKSFGSSMVYNKAGNELSVSVLDKTNGTLFASKYYDISYKNNTKAGGKNAAQVIVTGKNGYTGTVVYKYTITKLNISQEYGGARAELMETSYPYTKGGVKPLPKVTDRFDNELTINEDYTVSYKNNSKVVTSSTPDNKKPYLEIKGKGSFTGVIRLNFEIAKQSLSKTTAVAQDKAYSTKKGAMLSVPKLTDVDGKALSAGKDYDKKYVYRVVNETVVGDSTLPAGTMIDEKVLLPAGTMVEVEVKGLNNYTGSVKTQYRITTKAIGNGKAKIATKMYTGKEITLQGQDIEITYKDVEEPLQLGTDYEIVSYKNNIKCGTASVVIKGINNYSGTKEYKFSIQKRAFKWWWEK